VTWYPIARSDDLVAHHVFHGQLLGRELAVWRADDGFVNVWENRCLHRGVRLSIGLNEGQELKCQYHGWRYANRTAGCTYIPAHPADSPARTICNISFPAVERYGLVWTGDSPVDDIPAPLSLIDRAGFGLRNLPINAEPHVTLDELENYRFAPSTKVSGRGESWIELTDSNDPAARIVLFVQPVDAGRSVVRGVLVEPPPPGDRLAALHEHHRILSRLRDDIEKRAAGRVMPQPITPTLQRVPIRHSVEPTTSIGDRVSVTVTVARRTSTATGVVEFELRRVDGQLPTFQPGAHIDVQLPNGLTRQYSLVNGPGELDRYVIGVKREPDSRGGSACLHDVVRVGDVVAISEPRNNFPLRRDSFRTILIAGGIGLTPLLAMAQALAASALSYELHYFAQSSDHVAFADRLAPLGASVITHLGLSPQDTGEMLRTVLADPEDGGHVYICGPGPMLDAARAAATAAGWPDTAIHFEYFKNSTAIDTSSTFTIELARSALTIEVPAGTSVLEVLRANRVALPSSCEHGACGTCIVTVLAGEPDHQDAYLNGTERLTGDRMLTCVSRARSERLVLDI
jgi:ferredoxin-NADP reductase/nitrite reductase/ring-hydroxylating ferredoxin subunit